METVGTALSPANEKRFQHWLRVLRPLSWWVLLVLVLYGIRGHIGKQIEADGEVNITRIEIHHIIRSVRWNVVQQFLRQVSVRINQTNTMSKGDMLEDEIAQKRRFPGTRLSDDVYVLPLVCGRYAKGPRTAPVLSFPYGDVRFIIHDSKTSRHPYAEKVP